MFSNHKVVLLTNLFWSCVAHIMTNVKNASRVLFVDFVFTRFNTRLVFLRLMLKVKL